MEMMQRKEHVLLRVVVNLVINEMAKNGTSISKAVDLTLEGLTDHTQKDEAVIAGELVYDLHQRMIHDPYLKDWATYLGSNDKQKIAAVVKQVIRRRTVDSSV